MIANTPPPPYYAVIFSNTRTDIEKGYAETAARMDELAQQQEGFFGFESSRCGLGITISYWKDLESIKKWNKNAEE